MDLFLKDKKALVLGASTGIGFAIAKALKAEGVQVGICSRSEEKIKNAASEIQTPHFFTGDLSLEGEAAQIVRSARAAMGGLDILVTNTGGPKRGSFLEISSSQWKEDYQSIWMSVVEAMKEALPEMQKNGFGRILMVTSFAAREPRPGLTTSNGLRAGLNGLCRSVATEVAADGVTVNALLPGYTNTDRLKNLNLTPEKIKSMVPAGRLGEPAELADLALFLSSPRAAYITGQSIVVGGGA